MLEIVIALVVGIIIGWILPDNLHKHDWTVDSVEKKKSIYLDNRENVYEILKCKDCCKIKINVYSEKIKNV